MYYGWSQKIILFFISVTALIFFAAPSFATAAVLNAESATSVLNLLMPGVALDRLEWQATTDANDAVGVDIRGGDTAAPDGSWTGWTHLATTTGGATPSIANRASLIAASVNGKQYLQIRVNLETSSTSSQPSLDRLDVYAYRGDFTSSVYNSLSFVNGWGKISWNGTFAGGAKAGFQIRSSLDNTTWTPWCGPDNGVLGVYSSANCNSSNVFTLSDGSQPVDADLYTDNNELYLQYRAYLTIDANNLGNIPVLSQVTADYKNSPYSGTSTTPVEDGGSRPFHYDNISWKATTSPGVNGVYHRIRVGDDNTPGDGSGNWTAWFDVSTTTPGAGSTTIGDLRSLAAVLDGHRYYQLEIKLETADTNNFPSLDWSQVNTYTYNSGWFISSWYDTQDPSAEMGSMAWLENSSSTASHPYTVSIQAHTASSSAGAPYFEPAEGLNSNVWLGPNGTSTSYFNATNTVLNCEANQAGSSTSVFCPIGSEPANYLSQGGNDQFIQYKVYLYSDGWSAPVFQSINVSYGINIPPSLTDTTAAATSTGQAARQWKEADKDAASSLVIPNLDMTGKSFMSFALIDADTNGMANGNPSARTPGKAVLSVQYCDKPAGNCTLLSDWKAAATSSYNLYDESANLIYDGLGTYPSFLNSTTTVDVGDGSSTPAINYRLVFDPRKNGSLSGVYLPSFHFRVVADDSEGANRYGYLDSGQFPLDNKASQINSITIDAATQLGAKPAEVYLNVTDDTKALNGLWMRRSQDLDFSNDAWVEFNATDTVVLNTPTSTVYYEFKDAFENHASTSITAPAPPQGLMLADISNPVDENYKLFISWKKITTDDFNRYIIWRAATSTNCGDISLPGNLPCYESLDFDQYAVESTSTNNFLTDSGLSSTTVYYYKVTMENDSGNVSRYLDIIRDNPDGQGGTDKTPPNISDVLVTSTTTQSATIEWDTDELSKSMVYYLTEVEYLQNIASGTEDWFLNAKRVGLNGFAYNRTSIYGTHTVMLPKLDPDTTYYFKVSSEDASGNVGQVSEVFANGTTTPLTFRTKNGPKIESNPGISITGITNTSATVSWVTSLPADSAVIYSTSTTGDPKDLVAPVESRGSLTASTDHTVVVSGLEPGQKYFFYVISTDGEGNQAIDKNIIGGTPAYYDFTTTHDFTPPQLAGAPSCKPVVTDTDGSSGIIITSQTNESADIQLNYGFATDTMTGLIATSSNFSTKQVATLDNLSASTTYYFFYALFDTSLNSTTTVTYACNTIEPMIASSTADEMIKQALDGKVIEDEVGARIASSAAVMFDESVNNDPADATSTNWVKIARYGWLSSSSALSWVIASSSEVLSKVLPRIISTALEMVNDNNAPTSDASSTEWVKAARDKWVPDSQKEKHEGAVYGEGDLIAAREAGKKSSGGGGMIIIDKNDKKAPEISDIKVTDLGTSSARVNWKTSEDADGFVKYGITADYDKFIGFPELYPDHFFYLENLLPATKYHFQVVSKDGAGNKSISEDREFETKQLEPGETAGESGVIEASSTEPLSADKVKKAAQSMVDLLDKFSRIVSLNTFESQVVSQYDALQKLSSIIPAPILSGEPSVIITPTTATIKWHTDKPSNSLIGYSVLKVNGKITDYEQTVGDASNLVADHEVRIIGLKPDTHYNYQLRSKAKLGPEAISKNFNFKTAPEALEIVTSNYQVLSKEKAAFQWLTSQESDTQLTYTPYRDGKPSVDDAKTIYDKTLTTLHELSVPELEAGTIYQVELASKNTKGIKVTKLIPSFSTTKDDLPPEIEQIQTESALSQGKDTKVQTVISWTTNEPTIGKIRYSKGVVEDESRLTEETPIETTYSRRHTVIITKFQVGEIYSFRVITSDSGGNQSVSGTRTILTPKQREGVFELIIKTFESTFGWLGKMQ